MEVYVEGKKVTTLGPGHETLKLLRNIVITYTGDEYRGYAIKEDGSPVDSGKLSTDLAVVADVHNRIIRHIDKGRRPTMIGTRIKLEFVK